MPSRYIVLSLAALGPCLACASAAVNRDGTCELTPADSQYLVSGPVYRDCAVDQRARSEGRDIFPETFEPRIPLNEVNDQCYRVDIQFVVDTSGVPELATAQVVRSNHPEFAEAVLETLSRWRYRPARKGGVPVRQIVRESRAMAVRLVVVGPGSVGRPGRLPVC